MNTKKDTCPLCTADQHCAFVGCDWLWIIQLNWQSIKAVQLTQLLECSAQVLQAGLGTMKHLKACILIEDNAQPSSIRLDLCHTLFALRLRTEA